MSAGAYTHRYSGGPFDGLRVRRRQPHGRAESWHFGTREGSWMAAYDWSEAQAAFVFRGWYPLNHNRHPRRPEIGVDAPRQQA